MTDNCFLRLQRSDPDIASRPQPAAAAAAGPSAVVRGGGWEGLPGTPRQQQVQPQLEPGTPQSPKDGESEALRSRMAVLAAYLDRSALFTVPELPHLPMNMSAA